MLALSSVTTVRGHVRTDCISPKPARGDGTRRIALSGIARPERLAHVSQTITNAVEPKHVGFRDSVHMGGDECIGERV